MARPLFGVSANVVLTHEQGSRGKVKTTGCGWCSMRLRELLCHRDPAEEEGRKGTPEEMVATAVKGVLRQGDGCRKGGDAGVLAWGLRVQGG